MAKKLFELQAELTEAKAHWHENRHELPMKELIPTKEKIRELTAQIQEILTEGAMKCPECGRQPLGFEQPTYYQVSCTGLHDPVCQSQGRTIEQAVDRWNNENYFIKAGTSPIIIGAKA